MFKKIKNSFFVVNTVRLWPFFRPYLGRICLLIVLTIPLSSMQAVIAWSLRPYLDVISLEKGNITFLFPLFMVFLTLFQSVLEFFVTYLNAWVGNKVTADLKKILFKKLVRLDVSFFDRTTSGEIMFRFNQDADYASSGLFSNFKTMLVNVFSSISLIFVLLYTSWQLSIIAILALLFSLLPLTKFRDKINSFFSKSAANAAMVMTHYNEAFTGNKVITSFNLYNERFKSFDKTLDYFFYIGMGLTKRTGLVGPLMHFIVSFGIAGVIWFSTFLIQSSQLTAGGFVSFLTALLMLYRPIKSIGSNYTSIQMSLLSVDRVFTLLKQEAEIKNTANPVVLDSIKDSISFNNVSFGYNDTYILKNINFVVKKGEIIAFVGNSGGGKTTLVNLIPRFYDVKEGSIKIDGIDIKDIELDSLRSSIAMVFQDNVLFAGSIRDNILLGKENATKEELDKAIENACLTEFIQSLPSGLDTEIGERGVKLSGGQKQRVAIARAFLKNAPIVILDEATSALDNKSEAVVQQAIYNLMTDRTVFIIAHRLSTVKNADRIIVVDHGEIKEQGSHSELLLKPDSVYSTLYKTQIN